MKRYILIFLVFSAVAICYLSFPLSTSAHFVKLKDKKFYLDDTPFYPVVINYMASLQTDGTAMWPCTYQGYNQGFRHLYVSRDSCLMQLKADMDLIKEMGFNSVRIVGIGEEGLNKSTGALDVTAQIKNNDKIKFDISGKEGYTNYFNALDDLFKIAGEAGLKVIFLTRLSADTRSTEDHLRRLSVRFRDQPAIMAYDFFNEPLYFDSLERSKENVSQVVKRWGRTVRTYAPNQLSTIGLAGIREVFEWDPDILDVDFISLHPYEYEPDQVRNEIYWYSHNIKKPWIIGETAIPADNDSVSYEDQRLFARKTLQYTRDCNGQGYSWWQYKDVEWYSFHANYMGVVTLKGETKTAKKNIPVNGTVKPVAEEIKHFDPLAKKDDCPCLGNYYNYSPNRVFRLKGFVFDENGKPLKDAVIMAWNEWWSHSYHTVTKEDGSFELLSSHLFYHWMVSASGYSMVRGDIRPDTAKKGADPIPTLDIGIKSIEKLSF